jgi:DNA-binding ferritin-like protein
MSTRPLKKSPLSSSGSYSVKPTVGEMKTVDCDAQVSLCVSALMNAAVSLHKIHLKVTGVGSYASHKALNEIYDALPGYADSLAEGYQGATCKLLSYTETSPTVINSVEETIMFLKSLKEMINKTQEVLCYSEIINDLDVAKSAINSVVYKLTFLK